MHKLIYKMHYRPVRTQPPHAPALPTPGNRIGKLDPNQGQIVRFCSRFPGVGTVTTPRNAANPARSIAGFSFRNVSITVLWISSMPTIVNASFSTNISFLSFSNANIHHFIISSSHHFIISSSHHLIICTTNSFRPLTFKFSNSYLLRSIHMYVYIL